MKFSPTLLIALSTALLTVASPTTVTSKRADVALTKRGISQDVYDQLVWYWKYAISAYPDSCPRPNGNVLVKQISQLTTDTQSYIARDDKKKEIVAVFRGSESIQDALTDIAIPLIPFISSGVKPPFGTLIHAGFLTAWNSIATEVISSVRGELTAHPDYTIVVSGHSLGGAISSIAGIALKQNFPTVPLRLYSYGQPRVGNIAYAHFVNDQVGVDNIFRSVHTNDGVPTIPPRILGYWHHAMEYWQNPDPSSPSTVKRCNGSPIGEDPSCSNKILSEGINEAHRMYYGISSSSSFCS